jgi:hypothetical protein
MPTLRIFAVALMASLLTFAPACRRTSAISLTVVPQTGAAPLAVKLTATCTGCVAYTWDFGDGTHNTVPGPLQNHTYTQAGEFDAVVAASDGQGHAANADLIVKVTAAAAAGNEYCGPGNVWLGAKTDGPANLPIHCFNTALASTPSPGGGISVGAGNLQNLQAAYDGAQCGQTIYVPKGSVWGTVKALNFAPKNCDDGHWITIRSTSTALPPEGTRVTPADAPEMFRVNVFGSNAMNVGDHIRFIGMEVAKGSTVPTVNFAQLTDTNHVVFDRVFMHGNPGQESRRGIQMHNATSYVGVVDSWFSEFHCIAVTGACVDAQAIAGGAGAHVAQAGVWAIKNNFMEGAAETILLGGSVGDGCPYDIEIRRNHMYKPATWNPSDPGYVKPTYVVKNLFELKTGCRILFEGNVLENNWGGFSQVGFGLVIGPKNQDGVPPNQCPLCSITDLTMRYNLMVHSGVGLNLFNSPNDSGLWSSGGGRISMHDMIFDGMQYLTCYACQGGSLNGFSNYYSTTNPPHNEIFHDILLDHFTLIANQFLGTGRYQQHSLLQMNGPPPGNPTKTPQMSNIKLTNWIAAAGENGAYPTGGDSTQNCSNIKGDLRPISKFANCWIGDSLMSGNLLVGYHGVSLPSTSWPPGNFTVTDWSTVGFVNYNNGDGGDYHLAPTSPFRGKALDGKDPGADVDAVNLYTQGVRSVVSSTQKKK